MPWPLLEATSVDGDDISDTAIANPGNYFAQLWLARRANHAHDYVLGAKHAKAALVVRPDGASAWFELGLAELQQLHTEVGFAGLERAQRLSPGTPRFAWGLAVAASSQKRCKDVMPWIARAQLQSAETPEAVTQFGTMGKELLENCERPR